jgi:hypothetical protein
VKTARETVAPGSRAHNDITLAIEQGRTWFKNGLPYTPIDARREGPVIVIDLRLQDGQ